MSVIDFKVVLEPDPQGGYVVTCPSLPGCYSQGRDVGEALANIREAIELCVEDARERRGWRHEPVPLPVFRPRGAQLDRRPANEKSVLVSGPGGADRA